MKSRFIGTTFHGVFLPWGSGKPTGQVSGENPVPVKTRKSCAGRDTAGLTAQIRSLVDKWK